MTNKSVAIDLDNTLIDYRAPLSVIASRLGLDSTDRADIRQHLRRDAKGHKLWQNIQAEVYTSGLETAALADGSLEFLMQCKAQSVAVFVVSHKTKWVGSGLNHISLRDRAKNFLVRTGVLFDLLPESRLYFESTRDAKVARVNELGVSILLDDLPEVLNHPDLSPDIEAILFKTDGAADSGGRIVVSSFHQFQNYVFAR